MPELQAEKPSTPEQVKVIGTELTMDETGKVIDSKPKEATLPPEFTFDNFGNIVKNNRKYRRNFKQLWLAATQHRTSYVKKLTSDGTLANPPKLRYFTQHQPTRAEIRARRKQERNNRGK